MLQDIDFLAQQIVFKNCQFYRDHSEGTRKSNKEKI